MNFALIIALLIIFILLIVSIVVLFKNVNETITEKGAYVLDINQEPCYPNGDINNLSLVNQDCICTVNDTQTNTYAYTKNGLNFILSDIPIYFMEVCQSFCTTFDTKGKCTDSPTGTGSYAVCINTLTPITYTNESAVNTRCTQPSLPLARINDTPYYAVAKYAPNAPNDPGNCTLSSICSVV
jgi:hypothetical protein